MQRLEQIMNNATRLTFSCLLICAAMTPSAWAQYIGFVYPAGGQQGTKFHVELGGQGLDAVDRVFVTGEDVSVRVIDFYRNLGNQEIRFLSDQLRDLQRSKSPLSSAMVAKMMSDDPPPSIGPEEVSAPPKKSKPEKPKSDKESARQRLIDKLQARLGADNRQPANRSLSELVFVEVTIASGAKPGRREIRVATTRGLTNPMAFYIGQVPEVARRPMKTSSKQILGKESLAKRKRPPEEEEVRIALPCTMNGQIASGEVNRYRFQARKGQRLTASVSARQLIPFIADSVPGWFQPVLTLCDGAGNELAYNDDFRFKPDPSLHFDVPADGEYVLSINDALYRGREDFVYRITVGELPFVTSIFPMGARTGEPVAVETNGWNLEKASLPLPPKDAAPGTYLLTAAKGAFLSNPIPFAVDTLPESQDKEANDELSKAQKLTLPVIVNGRMDRRNDWDIFEVEGRAGDSLVAEVHARRLDSPLDSFLKITDADGRLVAFNDDHHDAGSGLNTHHADSYLMVTLPSDGKYCIHLGDTSGNGGLEYGYRLRVSPPRPDFELRVVPPSISIRGKSSVSSSVYALRKDGFDGPIKLSFAKLPKGFTSSSVILSAGQDVARLPLKTSLTATDKPVNFQVQGTASIAGQEVVRQALPAEDRMQAFLWRHLMPAQELTGVVYNPSYNPPATRVRPPPPSNDKAAKKTREAAKFTEKQVAGLRKQIERLYQEWFLTDDFANRELAKLQTN